jgi:hypothetical protein
VRITVLIRNMLFAQSIDTRNTYPRRVVFFFFAGSKQIPIPMIHRLIKLFINEYYCLFHLHRCIQSIVAILKHTAKMLLIYHLP